MIGSTQLKALHLEDYSPLGDILMELYASADIDATLIHDSDQALDALRRCHTGNLPLDVFVTDNSHPGLNAPELVAAIRNLPDELTSRGGLRIRHLPIVVFSATARAEDIASIDSTVPVIDKGGASSYQLPQKIDFVVREYRERVLTELHHVGFGVTWQAGKCVLHRCYVPRRSSVIDSKYIHLSMDANCSPNDGTGYHRLILVQDRRWSAQQAIAQLEELLATESTTERDLQRFFELHPEFLYENCHIEHWAEPVLRTDSGDILKPDFVLRPAHLSNRPWSWRLIDLKRHNVPVISNEQFHAKFSHHVHKVIEQLRDYSDFFENPANRDRVVQRFGEHVRKPNLVAVIGRLPRESALDDYARLKSRVTDVTLLTYDEILEDRRCRVERWAGADI